MQRLDHAGIINIMKSIGYPYNEGGVCHGIAMMAIQAFLTGEKALYNQRLDFMSEHKDTLVVEIRVVTDRIARRSQLSQKENPPVPVVLDQHEQMIIDVLAFLEGISLCQLPEEHSGCFDSSVSQMNRELISSMISSHILEELGGLKTVKSLLGAYTSDELSKLGLCLDSIVRQTKQSVALLLSSTSHSVALHYDVTTGKWYALDANRLKITQLHSAEDMAAWIQEVLRKNESRLLLATEIFVTGNLVDASEKLKTALNESPVMSAIHHITRQKADYANDEGIMLSHLAAQLGDVSMIDMLNHAGADLEKKYNENSTVALIATREGAVPILRFLFQAGVDLEKANGNGASPALLAAQKGNEAVIRMLNDVGVNLNAANKFKVTPALIAARYNQLSILQLLAEFGIDLSQEAPCGFTPLDVAEKFNAPECIAYLATYESNKLIRQELGFFTCQQQANSKPSSAVSMRVNQIR